MSGSSKGYFAAAVLGGAVGALLVARSTQAIPNMMSQMMAKMPDP